MDGYITTKHGTVSVDWDDDSLTIDFEHGDGRKVNVETERFDKFTDVRFKFGKRLPAPHDEITQNGSTFEVLGVRSNGEGYDVLNGNTGTWEHWVE